MVIVQEQYLIKKHQGRFGCQEKSENVKARWKKCQLLPIVSSKSTLLVSQNVATIKVYQE